MFLDRALLRKPRKTILFGDLLHQTRSLSFSLDARWLLLSRRALSLSFSWGTVVAKVAIICRWKRKKGENSDPHVWSLQICWGLKTKCEQPCSPTPPVGLVQTCSFPLTSHRRQMMLTARFVGVTDVVCLNWDFYLHFAKLCNQCIENWSSVKHILFYHNHLNSVTEYGSALSGCGFLKESPELGDYLWSQWHTIHREALPRKLIRHKKLNVFRHFCADYVIGHRFSLQLMLFVV